MSEPFQYLRTGLVTSLAFAIGVIGCAAQTLEDVKKRESLRCGVNEHLRGFSIETPQGWTGFAVDLCRAIAAAVFGDEKRVTYVPVSYSNRFEVLRSGEIDILSHNSTWTMSRETMLDMIFPAITYLDGQGFLIRKSYPATSVLEMESAKICVQSNTTTVDNLRDYFKANNMLLSALEFAHTADALQAYESGYCDVYTSDMSELHANQLDLKRPKDHLILPDVISKEPLGPAVRKGDDQWASIVKWTVFALINAEELGLSSKTIDRELNSTRPEIRRLIGKEGNYAKPLGMSAGWAVNIIRLVGNYGEIFDSNLGHDSVLNIPRGLNNLWTSGGILYAPPIR